jgi:hypothetical protein
VDPAGEPLLGGGDMMGRVVEENDPRVMPGELWSWVEATPGEPTGSSGKGLISVSGIAVTLATSYNTTVGSLRGPETGSLPSRRALAPSAAFHLAYCNFCSI